MTYFDSSTIIIGLVLLGRWLEARAKGQATGAIRRLVGLRPTTARVVRAAIEHDVPLEAVAAGRPPAGAARRPHPGRRGRRRGRRRRSTQSMLTGEPIPVEIGPGDEVIGATHEHDRHVRHAGDAGRAATRRWPGSSTSSSEPRAARRRSSAWPTGSAEVFVPLVLVVAALTFVAWFVAGPEPRLTLALTVVHRGPRHRLPVRDGARHADRDHGRDRAWCRGRAS